MEIFSFSFFLLHASLEPELRKTGQALPLWVPFINIPHIVVCLSFSVEDVLKANCVEGASSCYLEYPHVLLLHVVPL